MWENLGVFFEHFHVRKSRDLNKRLSLHYCIEIFYRIKTI